MIAIASAIIMTILFLLSIFFLWPSTTSYYLKNEYWWLVFLPIIDYLFILLASVCYMRAREDNKIRRRIADLDRACDNINKDYFKESGYVICAGDYGAWLEVSIDKDKSRLLPYP